MIEVILFGDHLLYGHAMRQVDFRGLDKLARLMFCRNESLWKNAKKPIKLPIGILFVAGASLASELL